MKSPQFFIKNFAVKDLSRMRNIQACMSPWGWIVISVATCLPLMILFRPSLKQYLVTVGVDTLALYIYKPLEGRIFKWLYPDTQPYFDGITGLNVPGFQLSGTDKKNLLESLVEFPRRRAQYAYFASFLKILPAIGTMVFYWPHQISNGMQFALTFGTCLVTMTYFYGSVFIDSHVFCSELLAKLHQQFDFREAFKAFNIAYKKREFEFHELLTLSFIIIFMFCLQGLIILSGDYSSPAVLAFKLATVGLAALLLFTRIWYLGRKYFFGALESLFLQFKFLDYRQASLMLPLHTSPLLGSFEQSFNLLVERLIKSEQNLSAIVCQEAEKGRYQALGEISGLVAHDLCGPLHAAQFWMSEIDERGVSLEEQRRLGHVRANLEQIAQLTLSLRARLKNSDHAPQTAALKDAHVHVIRLLETQFGDYALGKVDIQLDPELEDVVIAIPRVDLIQILDNIYRNSLKDLIKNQIVPASIRLSLGGFKVGQALIVIADNGSGLTADKFHRMTAYQFSAGGPQAESGLGLRLIKRLIEHHRGTLEIVEAAAPGTTFELSLPFTDGTVQGLPVEARVFLKESAYAEIQ